jgi:tRNA A-37 threonylcarbamoyl transferase component Bud32
MISRGSKLLYRVRLAIAKQVASVRLHKLDVHGDLPTGWLRKRRTLFAESLLPLGNVYLRMQGAPAEALSCRQWIEWEATIAEQLGRGLRRTSDSWGIEIPVIPGSDLEQLLRSNCTAAEKFRRLSAVSLALKQLHQVTLSQSPFADAQLSHGDATCRNVILDATGRTATWIDFDTRHRRHLPQLFRHADDLRALICSAAACLNPSDYEQCVDAVCTGYDDHSVCTALLSHLKSVAIPSVFSLAQAALSYDEFSLLRDAFSHWMRDQEP